MTRSASATAVVERLAAGSLGAVVDVHPQLRGEPRRLPLPVADQRHRADQQGRPERAVAGSSAGVMGEQGEQLDRLAQAHVVGQDAAEPDRLQEVQPGQTALLVRPQRAAEAGRRLDRLRAAASAWPASRSPSQPSALDAVDRQPAVGSSCRRRARAAAARRRSAVPVAAEQLQPGRQPARVELDPLPAQPDQRRLQLGQRRQLVRGQRLVAEGELAPVVDDRVEARAGSRCRRPCPAAVGVRARQPERRAGPTAGSTSPAAGPRTRRSPAAAPPSRRNAVRAGGVQLQRRRAGPCAARASRSG